MRPYPQIRVGGEPRQRGQQYGEQARKQIQLSIDGYREVFQALAGWNWERVRSEASRFEMPIAEFDSRYMDEIRGIAEGAGVPVADILAINVRTEVMYGAKGRDARDSGRQVDATECTSLAALPSATRDGRTVLAQNWDWLPHCFETVVILEVQQDEGPDFVTIVEAGLLAKVGMNSSGIGIGANALASGDDLGVPGVPFHVVLRALFDAETLADAMSAIQRSYRSSSANYLLAHEVGAAFSVETAPGDYRQVFPVLPRDGIVIHTNHFLSPRFQGTELSSFVMPDSCSRLVRATDLLTTRSGDLTVKGLQQLFRDHGDFPMGICFHPDPRAKPADQSATIFSAILDLASRHIHLSDGYPCQNEYRLVDYSTLLSKKPSPLRPAVSRDTEGIHSVPE